MLRITALEGGNYINMLAAPFDNTITIGIPSIFQHSPHPILMLNGTNNELIIGKTSDQFVEIRINAVGELSNGRYLSCRID